MHFASKWGLATFALASLLQGTHLYGKIIGPDERHNRMMRLQQEQPLDPVAQNHQVAAGWSTGMGKSSGQQSPEQQGDLPEAYASSEPLVLASNQHPSPPKAAPVQQSRTLQNHRQLADSMKSIGYTGIDEYYKWRDRAGDLQYSVNTPARGVAFKKIAIKPGENIIKSLPRKEIDRLLGRLDGKGDAVLPAWVADVFDVQGRDVNQCGADAISGVRDPSVCVSKVELYAALQRALSTVN